MNNKIRLVRLEISHFRSVRDTIEFDFPERGVILLQGASGSGKSTFILALSVILECCPFAMTELQSWHTDKPFQVKATFHSTKYGTFSISRGAKNKLEQEGKKALTSVKSIAEEMYKLFDVPSELSSDTLKDLTYCPQQEDSDFLTWPNADKQSFLASLLGMNRFEVAVELANQNGANAMNRAGGINTQLMSKADFMLALQEQMKQLPMADMERERALKARVDALQYGWDQADNVVKSATTDLYNHDQARERQLSERRHEILGEYEPKLAEQEKFIQGLQEAYRAWQVPPPTEEEGKLLKVQQAGNQKLQDLLLKDVERRTAFDKQHAAWVKRDAELGAEIRGKMAAEASIQRVRERVATLQGKKCPTCNRDWADAHFEAEEAEERRLITQLELVKQAETDRVTFAAVRAQAGEWSPNPEIEKLTTTLKALDERVRQLKNTREVASNNDRAQLLVKKSEVQAAIEALKAERAVAVKALDTEGAEARQLLLNALRAVETVAANALSELKLTRVQYEGQVSANKQANDGRASLQAQMDALTATIAKLTAELDDANAKLALEMDFVAAVGREGFMGSIFDEIIDEIAVETNARLGRVANTSTVVIDFRSESETEGGKVKKQIKPYITVGGFQAQMKSGLSGGMLSTVKLTSKISRRAVISRRTGVNLGWLFLDEPFDGMGRADKESAMEILNEIAADDLVIVVDHGDSFKGQFAKTLLFELSHGVTTMKEVKSPC